MGTGEEITRQSLWRPAASTDVGEAKDWRPLRFKDRRPGPDARTSHRLADEPLYSDVPEPSQQAGWLESGLLPGGVRMDRADADAQLGLPMLRLW